MEASLLQPRGVVLDFGASVLAPQLESVASVQAVHRSLCAVATRGSDGNRYVSAAAAASALEMPAEQCQLLLYTLAAVGGVAGAAAALAAGAPTELGGAAVCDLSLFFMAQLYNRETQKPETQDHWPDPHNSTAQVDAALKASSRAAQPGSPGGASNSRMLIKHQLQQQQQRQKAYTRGYAEFLQKHQKALLELVMDDSSAADAWQQQRTAAIQQHKAAQLQLQQPPRQQQQPPAVSADSEMTPAEDPAAAASASEVPEESMQASPTRLTTDDGACSQLQPSGDADATAPAAARSSSGSSLASLVRCSSVPPVVLTASEFDRLGFLLEVGAAGKATAAAAAAAEAADSAGMQIDSGSAAAPAVDKAAAASGAAASGHDSSSSSSSSRKLSAYVPGYAQSATLTMEELLAWMAASWAQQPPQQQQKAAAGNQGHAAASPAALLSSPATAGGAAAGSPAAAAAAAAAPSTDKSSTLAAAAAGGAAEDVAWLGMASSPPSSSLAASMGALSSPPPSAVICAAGGSPGPLGVNGLLPTASPVTPTNVAAGAAPGIAGAGLGLSSIRINPINTSSSSSSSSSSSKGMVAVAAGTVDERGVCGVYRGTVVWGPSDVTRDEVTIANCIECHIYLLAPVKLARITNCTDCTVCIGAVGSLLRIDCCERLQLTAAAEQVLVVSCHSCCLHLGTPRQPALLGDCRFVKFAPYNTRYETLLEHMASAGMQPNQASLWDQPLVLPCSSSSSTSNCGGNGSSNGGSSGGSGSSGGAKSEGGAGQQLQRQRPGASTPSSPHTHGSSGSSSERRGGASPKPVLLMQPEEFLPLVVPFRGTSGPLAGGAAHAASTQWLPGIHKQQAGPLPPLPFPLPDAFDAALQHQYAVVTDLRAKIRGSGLDEGRRHQLQGVIQSYFREWLHSSGAIRQVYDLSKLEGDEFGPAGGSPPATALRDHSQL